jgi:hypothetical protein
MEAANVGSEELLLLAVVRREGDFQFHVVRRTCVRRVLSAEAALEVCTDLSHASQPARAVEPRQDVRSTEYVFGQAGAPESASICSPGGVRADAMLATGTR